MTIHHPLDAFKTDSNERYFNNAGQINAGSNAEALKVLVDLSKAIQSGRISEVANQRVDQATILRHRQERKEAFDAARKAGVQSKEWADVGAQIAATLQQTAERTGFARSRLLRGTIGDPTRFRVKDRSNVIAVVLTTEGAVAPTYVTDGFVEAPELLVSTNPRALLSDVNRGHVDLVEDIYVRGQQAFGVQEDRYYMNQVRRAAAVSGNNRLLASQVTVEIFGKMRADVEGNGLPAATLTVGSDVLPDFLSPGFASALNNVHDYERIRTGTIATIANMEVVTDGLRPANLRVMDPKEVFVSASPEYHGGFADRGPIQSTPRDTFDDGLPAQGWFMWENIALAITNAQSVSLAYRP